MPRPILATIHLDALAHNLRAARRRAAGRRVWAVVKANAYGHGLERVLPAFAEADGLALLDLDEARRARAAGWRKPILLLEGLFEPADLPQLRTLELTTVVHRRAQIGWLGELPPGPAVPVYLKLNTGMNRLGFSGDAAEAALAELRAMPQVAVEAVMTHFANADRADEAGTTPVSAQLAELARLLPDWRGPLSLANSAALFVRDDVGGDSVRPGIALYGGKPVGDRAATELGLRAGMSLMSQVLAVLDVPLGGTLGYGSRWSATRPSRVAVIACGYADGYPRVARDGTPVAVAGRIAPLAGRVSMDMITVDVTDLPPVAPGDPVELWGAQVPIDVVAEAAGTVGYELMCALAQRVPVRVVGA